MKLSDRKRAEALVDALLADLDGRSGFDLGSLDDETRDELRETWIEIVKEAL